VGELDLAISDYSVALELDMKASENEQTMPSDEQQRIPGQLVEAYYADHK